MSLKYWFSNINSIHDLLNPDKSATQWTIYRWLLQRQNIRTNILVGKLT